MTALSLIQIVDQYPILNATLWPWWVYVLGILLYLCGALVLAHYIGRSLKDSGAGSPSEWLADEPKPVHIAQFRSKGRRVS